MNKMNIVTIADIHFNAIPADKMYEQLDGIFLSYIKKHKIDMIVFAGDFYDSIISFNSQFAHLSTEFFKKTVEISVDNGIKYIRVLKGTRSHDNNQIVNLKVFEDNTKVSIRIIESVTRETIEGMEILYIPEEYMKDVNEFYKDYLNGSNKYDMIFGHGMFKETSFAASKQESAITLSGAPVFDSKKMCDICNGFINFGHIHTSCGIRKKITYVGSFSRWVFGEEEKKGFLVTSIDKDTKKFSNEFIENVLADRYDTITLIDIDKYVKEPKELITHIDSLNKGKLRVIIIVDNNSNCSYLLSFLRENYAKNKNIKLQITDKTLAKKEMESEEQMDDLMKKYGFVFSKIPKQEIISKFIKIRDKSNKVSADDVNKELSL